MGASSETTRNFQTNYLDANAVFLCLIWKASLKYNFSQFSLTSTTSATDLDEFVRMFSI